MNLDILPECYADTLVVETINYKKPNHCTSIGEVSRVMQVSYKNRLAIGVIDKDKPGIIPNYFKAFETLLSEDNLELCWHPDTKHFTIVVAPALEQWLLNTASDLGVSASKYGFATLKKLKRVTKDENASKNNDLKQFINNIWQKKDSPLQKMEDWIALIQDKRGKIAAIKRALGIEEGE